MGDGTADGGTAGGVPCGPLGGVPRGVEFFLPLPIGGAKGVGCKLVCAASARGSGGIGDGTIGGGTTGGVPCGALGDVPRGVEYFLPLPIIGAKGVEFKLV